MASRIVTAEARAARGSSQVQTKLDRFLAVSRSTSQ
jgi:hypothetical protein